MDNLCYNILELIERIEKFKSPHQSNSGWKFLLLFEN